MCIGFLEQHEAMLEKTTPGTMTWDLPIPVICFHGELTFPMSSNPPISARLALEGQLVQDCQQGIHSQ